MGIRKIIRGAPRLRTRDVVSLWGTRFQDCCMCVRTSDCHEGWHHGHRKSWRLEAAENIPKEESSSGTPLSSRERNTGFSFGYFGGEKAEEATPPRGHLRRAKSRDHLVCHGGA